MRNESNSSVPDAPFSSPLFLYSSGGSLPQETVVHRILQCGSFPWAAVLQELLQHVSFTQGMFYQEQTDPWAPYSITCSVRKPTLLFSLSTQDTDPDRNQLYQGDSTGTQLLSGHIHLLWHWILHS